MVRGFRSRAPGMGGHLGGGTRCPQGDIKPDATVVWGKTAQSRGWLRNHCPSLSPPCTPSVIHEDPPQASFPVSILPSRPPDVRMRREIPSCRRRSRRASINSEIDCSTCRRLIEARGGITSGSGSVSGFRFVREGLRPQVSWKVFSFAVSVLPVVGCRSARRPLVGAGSGRGAVLGTARIRSRVRGGVGERAGGVGN